MSASLLLLLTVAAVSLSPSKGQAYAPPPPREIGFELEVARCPEGILSLTQVEAAYLKGARLNTAGFDLGTSLVVPLAKFSPARARALSEFESQIWTRLQKLEATTLRPRLPTTALFHRRDCTVEIVAAISSDVSGKVSGLVDANLWAAISRENRSLLLAEAYFYFETSFWRLLSTFGPVDPDLTWDPTRARFFLTEWLMGRQPETNAAFYALATEASLGFVEQSGIFISLIGSAPEVSASQDFIRSTANAYDLRQTPWSSSIKLGSRSFNYDGWIDSGYETVTFRDDGSIHCLPWDRMPAAYSFPQLGAADLWKNRLCFFPDGSIESGYLAVPWSKPATWKFGSTTMVIDNDPLAGGPDQGTEITFFPDHSIKTILNSRGVVTLQGQTLEMRGPMRFERTAGANPHLRLACATPPQNSSWLNTAGQKIVAKTDTMTFCFNDQERVVTSCVRPYCFPNERADRD